MPCSKQKDQEQPSRRNTFRTSFSRTLTGFRFPEQHPQHHHIHHHHHNHTIDNGVILQAQNAANDEVDDLADQLRVSVQEAHLIQQSFISDFGGNITAVFDNCDESPHQYTTNYDHNSHNLEYIAHSYNNSSRPNQISNGSQTNAIAEQTPTTSSQNHINTGSAITASVSSATMRIARLNTTDDCESDLKESVRQDMCNPKNGTRNLNGLLKSVNSVTQSDARKIKSSDNNVGKSVFATNQNENEDQDVDDLNRLTNDDLQIESARGSSPAFCSQRQIGIIKTNLYSGASFSGYQESTNESYQVNVKIQYIDYANSYLCGYLTIYNLTKSHPSLTTFFEGEIISAQHPFHTRKWDATEEIDLSHWSKFEGFQRYSSTFNSDKFDYGKLNDSDYIFMRWKEHFLVPDHKIKQVDGASYEGFYYICFSKRTSSINGYYFHINTRNFESFQSLNLHLDQPLDRGLSQVFEFR